MSNLPVNPVEALAANTLIAIANGMRDLPQYASEIGAMQRDMERSQPAHPKLCLCLLAALEEMYEGRYQA